MESIAAWGSTGCIRSAAKCADATRSATCGGHGRDISRGRGASLGYHGATGPGCPTNKGVPGKPGGEVDFVVGRSRSRLAVEVAESVSRISRAMRSAFYGERYVFHGSGLAVNVAAVKRAIQGGAEMRRATNSGQTSAGATGAAGVGTCWRDRIHHVPDS